MRTKPKIELDLEKVEEYAGLGLTREEIALSLGVSYSTLNRRVKESEEVDAAMKRGRAKANIKVGNALMKAIDRGRQCDGDYFLSQGTRRLDRETTD